MLCVRQVNAGYGVSQVLFDVSLGVNAGEVVTLLGRNGMGKTTTNLAITERDGTTTKLNEPGAPLDHAALDALTRSVLGSAEAASWVVLSGSLPPGVPDDWYAEIVAQLEPFPCKVAVDTSEVSETGSCKIESWASWAGNQDLVATINPSCVVSLLGQPFELSAQIARSRADDDWATSIAPKAKTKLIPTSIGNFGLAIAGGATYDFAADEIARSMTRIRDETT